MSQPVPVFVVSTGRTATTFVAELFADRGAVGLHEPGPWWLRHVANAYVSERLDHDRAVSILQRQRADLDVGRGYVEASCLVYGLVGPLLDARPDAHVVHVVRDPRSYLASALDWGVYRFGGRPLNLAPYRRLAPPQRRPLDPAARLRWAGRDQFARLTWAWTAMNEAMRRQGTNARAKGSDRFTTVRFEDLTDPERGPEVLTGLAARAGIELSADDAAAAVARPVNTSGASTGPTDAWRTWSDRRLTRLVRETAAEAAHYGYPVADEVGAELEARSG